MATVRTFIALPLPAHLASTVASIQEQLVASGAEVKWEPADKFHITLKFLGDTETSLVPQLTDALRKSLGSFKSFDVSYVKLGAFPNVDHPRVVWVGTHESQSISQLRHAVETVCSQFGFTEDDRAFHGHITLGRLKGSRNLVRLTASLKSITFEPFLARCSQIHFMRSELKPSGSVYSLLHSISLAS